MPQGCCFNLSFLTKWSLSVVYDMYILFNRKVLVREDKSINLDTYLFHILVLYHRITAVWTGLNKDLHTYYSSFASLHVFIIFSDIHI